MSKSNPENEDKVIPFHNGDCDWNGPSTFGGRTYGTNEGYFKRKLKRGVNSLVLNEE